MPFTFSVTGAVNQFGRKVLKRLAGGGVNGSSGMLEGMLRSEIRAQVLREALPL